MPPLLPWSAASQDLGVPAALCSCWSDPDGQKDAENREMVGKQTRYESVYQDQLCTH